MLASARVVLGQWVGWGGVAMIVVKQVVVMMIVLMGEMR